MAKKIKTTWDDIDKPNCIKKEYKMFEGFSSHGKSTVDIDCPFCGAEVTAFIWSLRGCGKRCECGALFSAFGDAYKVEKK